MTMPSTSTNPTPATTIPGTKVLLLGDTGSGKTTSIRSLYEAGLEVFVIATEPGIASILGDLPSDKVHWHYIPPALPGWEDLLDNAKKINSLSYESLSKQGSMNKEKYSQFFEVIATCANFKCDRTGQTYGNVSTWGTDRVLVVDSLSGLNIMAMDLVVGAKPVKSPGDWGVAMDNLERLVNAWTFGVKCHFVLIAHMDREKDEVTGGTSLMVATLGQKLAPRLGRYFDEVLQAVNDNGKFAWRSISLQAKLKSRFLPLSEKLPASFSDLIQSWRKKTGGQ